jgi:membrane associated rhomboid family serine protease
MTLIIIAITVIVSFIAFQRQDIFARLQFNAYLMKHSNEWHRGLSHALLHVGWLHLLVNMWVLWNFGTVAEEFFGAYRGRWGDVLYLALYVGGVLFSTLPAYIQHQDNFSYNAVGASGAVSAALFSSIYFLPTMGIYIMFIPIAIPAFVIGPLYLAYEWYQHRNSTDNVAHDAHFWGAAFGFVVSIMLVPEQFPMFVKEIGLHLGM